MTTPSKFRLIDLSQPVYDLCPHCPADPEVSSKLVADHTDGGWRVEVLSLTSHTGSHVDAPLHKCPGAPSIDAFPVDRFTGQAYIIDLRQCRAGQPFTSSMMSRSLRHQRDLRESIILLATGWGEKRARTVEWEKESPFLSPDGAEWLVEQEIRGVGIDHFSIGGVQEPTNTLTHQALLGANVWVAEDLRFPPEVFNLPQPVQYWGLPIHLRGHGGAFCRPVLAVPA